jgi:hypothetical protein
MKKLIYLLALVLISSSSFSQKVDFSGDWKLNKEKSTLGEQFSMAPNTIEMSQDKNSLTEVRHANYQGEDFTFTDKYTLDGKECENPGWMDSIKKSTASWSDDNKVLNIITKIAMQDGGEMTITAHYSLDGDNLLIKTTASSSYGDMTEKQVYDKQ